MVTLRSAWLSQEANALSLAAWRIMWIITIGRDGVLWKNITKLLAVPPVIDMKPFPVSHAWPPLLCAV